ncbi:hypothetical protein LRH25_00815 [Ideonella azotifigens]|uniref:Helicase n=1 Tax=Ideonella azotifigens TaxID=513160 RepID=A0ABN1KAB4_9BURK|nr:helicase [Ideonella azotifigens]MCD2338879.1 hypothetical protein [Ideonella azotifigens]
MRQVRVGGASKAELLAQLEAAGVALNEAGKSLFADERFTTSAVTSLREVVELAVAELGFAEGATWAQVIERAMSQGLTPCPLELGPHLRLQFLDQAEGFLGQPVTQHRAPPGSLTVASLPIAEDDDTPKGFYLRRIEGVLWLRGYRSGADHLWSPEDRLVFCRAGD